MTFKNDVNIYDGRKHQRIALYMASPPYKGLFRWHERFRLERVDPLEEGRRPRRVWPNQSTLVPRGTQIPYSTTVDLVAGLERFILDGPLGSLRLKEWLQFESCLMGKMYSRPFTHKVLRHLFQHGRCVPSCAMNATSLERIRTTIFISSKGCEGLKKRRGS
ncbi:hypothetical protein M9H77_02523 [Catharanthus roseus]|uniref:Uncharacterized protein n=1 Tax=Catharanthus roseus TaxID=4058 RepID=A0ACC0C950_CATRO|nr:hypothetical protein M9H77_02523 [Catharanthus roseus]